MDLGSGIRKNLFRIPDPGVKKAPDPGSGSATLLFIYLLSSAGPERVRHRRQQRCFRWMNSILVFFVLIRVGRNLPLKKKNGGGGGGKGEYEVISFWVF
jgi:hypothetical protein